MNLQQAVLKNREERISRILSKISYLTSVPGEITRQTFSGAWEDGIEMISQEMIKLDMQVRMDGFGNLIGVYNPGQSEEKPIGMGSHLDTVINGGAYDGVVGIVAGLEVIQIFKEKGIIPKRPVEVIAFAEEEGGVFGKGCLGSEYITGNTSLEKINGFQDAAGRTPKQRANALKFIKRSYGSDFGWGKNYYHAFFEIHVEQGIELQKCSKQIGIVDGVVGILRSEVTFSGQPNHAGTTEMVRRKDAMVALAEFIVQAYRYGRKENGKLVVTNGKIRVFPNQHNVVPGEAASVMEMRAETDMEIQQAYAELQVSAKLIAEQYHLSVSFSEPVYVKPVAFDKGLLEIADNTSKDIDKTTHIFSWAGHDAKLMSKVAPSMMLFVPSKNGMSHCPEEYSESKDIIAASEFLLNMIMEMK